MRKTIKIIATTSVIILLVYLLGLGFYSENFVPNTKFSKVNISHLSQAQAQEKIAKNIDQHTVTLTEHGQDIAQINLADLDKTYNLNPYLDSFYQSQDPMFWFTNFFSGSSYGENLSDYVSLNCDQLKEQLATNGITNDNRQETKSAYLDYSPEEGYHVESEFMGDAIDYYSLADKLVDSASSDEKKLPLEDCYQKPQVTSDSDIVKDALDKIDEISSVKISLEIAGEEVIIPKEEIEKWIYFDQLNQLVVDESVVGEYLKGLNEKYSTYNKERSFNSTHQGLVTVQPGILGWQIDIDKEAQQIASDIQQGQDVKRPVKTSSSGGIANAADDIGDTYVEVDLTYQQMFLYVDGELIVQTDIVSGKPGAFTEPGANAVNEMKYQTNLVGYNHLLGVEYSTPVTYWIRFDDKAQGIHDAPWQSWFGGDAYLTAGSLGCINTPYEAVSIIYENVDYGTPVIVF